jgi:mono/diheme cytochrome c family protein
LILKHIYDMIKQLFSGILFGAILLMGFQACSPAKGNSPGHEYMPDMAHSVAYEANRIDEYSLHTWDKQSTKTLVDLWGTPRLPVKGTIPRGYVGGEAMMAALEGGGNGIYTPKNGNVPYYYGDTEEERTRATKEIVANPYPITKARIAKGKELWTIYCGVCHGANCNGNGYLVSEENPNAKYPAQPANLLLDTFANGNNGRLYHGIMYGKNVMGGYADKLSYEERWDVIHYIRSCQAAEKKLEYNDRQNTLNKLAATTDSAYQVSVALRRAASAPAKPAETKPTAPAPTGQHSGDHSGGQH